MLYSTGLLEYFIYGVPSDLQGGSRTDLHYKPRTPCNVL